MEFKVYILFSTKLGKYYEGQTSDLTKRLERHNQGRERFTRTGTPWELIYSKPCVSRGKAMVLEKRFRGRISEDLSICELIL
ncbi:GIY-YIG nuclease family protein [Algoriphagus halophilus]|uniref:Putative endonuclease n=1 Tax=Algoriphagus halophilus TaxID=226505 RepID=A0A1N6EKZ4_9BACT|nr:GIY-YIG nuclease family protein [Algoriphagus halophilus]SIN83627.1 putative endonuclease [Algoriphagus halophilus]